MALDNINAEARRLLNQFLRTDADFAAFVLDHFPATHQRFSLGMDRMSRTNLLLEGVGAEPVLTKLKQLRQTNEGDLFQLSANLLNMHSKPSCPPHHKSRRWRGDVRKKYLVLGAIIADWLRRLWSDALTLLGRIGIGTIPANGITVGGIAVTLALGSAAIIRLQNQTHPSDPPNPATDRLIAINTKPEGIRPQSEMIKSLPQSETVKSLPPGDLSGPESHAAIPPKSKDHRPKIRPSSMPPVASPSAELPATETRPAMLLVRVPRPKLPSDCIVRYKTSPNGRWQQSQIPPAKHCFEPKTEADGLDGSLVILSFWISSLPITQRQWELVMHENPSLEKMQSNPVDNFSYQDALRFCNRLSQRENLPVCYPEISYASAVKKNRVRCGYRVLDILEWDFLKKQHSPFAKTVTIAEGLIGHIVGSNSSEMPRNIYPLSMKLPKVQLFIARTVL